jgi:hypothetical protein
MIGHLGRALAGVDHDREPALVGECEHVVEPWGWHGGFPRGLRIAGPVSVVFLIGLMYPHDQQLGRIHLLWLTDVAAVILIAVVLPRNRRP